MTNRERASLCSTSISALCALYAPGTFAQENNDIIVTARRVEERLQDVPISISVFSQKQITYRNITDAGDLAAYTPSLQADTRFGSSNANFSIRGFTQEITTSPSVAVYFADVVALRGGSLFQSGDGAGPGAFFDLQNAQVLKGPQGTLFGRNTTGGAVLLVPKTPSRDFEGYIEGSIGNYDMRRLQAVVNVPISDMARLRLGIDRQTRDGFLRNFSPVGPRDMNDTNYVTARASLVLDLTPTLENYTILTYLDSKSNGTTTKITDCSPTILTGGIPTGFMACQQIARLANRGFYAVENVIPNPENNQEQWQVINTTTWRASDALTIKNIVSYGELKNRLREDAFGTYFVVPGNATRPTGATPVAGSAVGAALNFSSIINAGGLPLNHQSTFTEELQFQGQAAGGKLRWQAGGYYERSAPLAEYSGSISSAFMACPGDPTLDGGCLAPYGPVGNLSYSVLHAEFTGIGVYAQGTYDLTDVLRVTGGIRYTWDRSDARARQLTYRLNTAGQLILTSCTSSDAVLPACVANPVQKTDAPTWVVDLDYHPKEDVLVYLKYSRGYRAGQAFPRGLFPNNKYEVEKVDTYELGPKIPWDGPRSGNLNAAVFYNKFQNQQLLVAFIAGTRTTNSIVSAGKSEIYGAEVEGNVRLFDGFKLSAAYTYLHTELTDFTQPAPPAGYAPLGSPIIGLPLTFSPKHKWSATAAYTVPIPEHIGEVSVSATYSATSSYLATIAQFGSVAGYGLLNLNLNWTNVARAPVDVSLFATNVADKQYYVHSNDFSGNLGWVNKALGAPRMYGVRLRYRFGSSAD